MLEKIKICLALLFFLCTSSYAQMIADAKPTIKQRADSVNVLNLYHSNDLVEYVDLKDKLEKPDQIDLRSFVMPTTHTTITSRFGPRWGRMHKGLDIKVYIGDTIKSAFSGVVTRVEYDAQGYGNFVVIQHTNGLETRYAHLSKYLVKKGQGVAAGETIGLGGTTGRSTGSHLHFEIRYEGVAINPELLFDFPHQDVTMDFCSISDIKKAMSGTNSQSKQTTMAKTTRTTKKTVTRRK